MIIDNKVVIATRFDAVTLSLPNFVENIVVAAAIGALAETIIDTGIIPRIPTM